MYKDNSYDLLLHKEVCLPRIVINASLNLQKQAKNRYSKHLLVDRLENVDYKHNYCDKDLQKAIDTIRNNPVEPFEVGLTKIDGRWFVEKCCVRISYDNLVDICLVIGSDGTIITAWLNDKTDTHRTLKRDRYNTKDEYEEAMKK